MHSDLLRFLFLILIFITVIIVVIVLFLVLLLIVRFLRIVLLLLLALLHLTQILPLLQEVVGLGLVISDNDVVEDRAALPLPQVEAKETEVVILVNHVVI